MLILLAWLAGDVAWASLPRIAAEATGFAPETLGSKIILHDQFDAASGNGTPDQDFEPGLDPFDASAADDFVVPPEVAWWVHEVQTIGTSGLAGGAQVSVFIRTNSVGIGNPDLPGSVLAGCSYERLVPTTDESGSFVLVLPSPCLVPAGRFWLEVQTHQNANTHGQHFWSNRSIRTGSEAAWRNPADGFGTGCTDFRPQTQCGVGGGVSPDLLFRIVGEVAGADLSVSMLDTPDPAIAGESITFHIEVRNSGPAPASGLELTSDLPPDGSLASAQADDGGVCTVIAARVRCSWASALAAAGMREVALVVRTSPQSAANSVLLTATQADADTSDPDPTNNTATAQTTIATMADLQVLAEPAVPAIAGETFGIEASARNSGPSDANDLELNFVIPTAAHAISAVAPGGDCTLGATVTCRWTGGTAPGVVRRASLIAELASSAVASLTLPISADADTSDPNPGDNESIISMPVQTLADIALDIDSSPDPVQAGEIWTIHADLRNHGPSDARDPRVQLTIPEGAILDGADPGEGGSCIGSAPLECVWIGMTPAAGVRRLVARLRVHPSIAPPTTLIAQLSAASATSDDNQTNNLGTAMAAVTATADLRASLAPLDSSVTVGEITEALARLENLGPSDAQDSELRLTLNPDLRFSGIDAPGADCQTPETGQGGLVRCRWPGPMAALSAYELRLRFYGGSPGISQLSATATALSPDHQPANNAANARFTVADTAHEVPGPGPLAMLVLGLGMLLAASRSRLA